MKILNILNENFELDVDDDFVPTPKQPINISLSDLNSMQLRTLQRLNNGEVDIDSANDKEAEIIVDLHDLGLLDDNYEISDAGNQVLSNDTNSEDAFRVKPETDLEDELSDFDFDLNTDEVDDELR